jgi:type IV secretion system protein VirB9
VTATIRLIMFNKIIKINFLLLSILLINKNAIAENPMPIDSRIKTLIYSPNEIFQIKFMVGYRSIIELQQDEEVSLISFGDPIPWNIKVLGRRIFIKPTDPGVKTNMTLITNKRTYLMEIASSESPDDFDDKVAYIVRFFYPNVNIDMPPVKKDISINEKVKKVSQIAANSLSLTANNNEMNFNYTYAGEAKEILPNKIFDNGNSTYFKFKGEIIPNINAIATNGTEINLKLHISGEYVVVNSVERQFVLRDKNTDNFLCIFNENIPKIYVQN